MFHMHAMGNSFGDVHAVIYRLTHINLHVHVRVRQVQLNQYFSLGTLSGPHWGVAPRVSFFTPVQTSANKVTS